ncbi:hypothetical protein [Actinomyces oricola]|uniref:hypothetical protein n=1 Tax=Actinomyces oricola TaxID=206043 RepID=UPI000FFF49CE|nr:hypothetical protein [Actinomyces oricola]
MAENIVAMWGRSTLEALDKALAKVGTFWVDMETPDVSSESSATAYVVDSTEWISGVLLIGSIMVASIYVMWNMRGEEIRKIVGGVLRMIIISGLAATVTQLAINISDGLSTWFLTEAVDDMNGSFATKLLVITSVSPTGVGWLTIILGGICGIIANLIQMGLMFVRSAMLVLITGIIPLASAAALTDWGKEWLSKIIGWTVAFALMKPAAAIIYGVAIKLVTSNSITAMDDLGSFIQGIILMVMAAMALPALVKFVVPAAGAVASGSGAAVLAGGAGAVATGAVHVTRSGGSGGSSGRGSSGSSGDDGDSGPTGARGRPGAGGSSADASSGASGTARGASGASSAGASGAAGAGGGGASGASSAGASGAAGGGVAGGAAMVVMAGLQVAQKGADVVVDTTEEATGESASGAGEVAR